MQCEFGRGGTTHTVKLSVGPSENDGDLNFRRKLVVNACCPIRYRNPIPKAVSESDILHPKKLILRELRVLSY